MILDIRRNLVLDDTRIPPEIERVYRNLEWFGNTFGMGKMNNEPWLQAENRPASENTAGDAFVFWVGCQGYFHERNQKTIQAVLSIFQRFDIKYVVLGQAESCCGDLARRTGNDYLFNQLAENNLKLFDQHKVDKIVTHCPHCLNVFRYEYPQLGGNFETLHYTEILDAVFNQVNPKIHTELIRKVTFHDPCYLSRYNEIIFEPRRLLEFVPGAEVIEMERSKENTLCCGAGGGCMWLGRQAGRGLNEMRAEAARDTLADLLLTSCPYCLNMLEEGNKNLSCKRSMQVADLAELLDQVLI
jgi:Fe-S oxidoreductase